MTSVSDLTREQLEELVINNKLLKPDKELRRKQINNKWYENNKNYHKEHYKKNEENIRIRNRYYYYTITLKRYDKATICYVKDLIKSNPPLRKDYNVIREFFLELF